MTKLIVILIIIASSRICSAGNLLLLEFPTSSLDSTREALQVLASTGAFARHIFAPNMAIVEVPRIELCKSQCAKFGVSAFETNDERMSQWSGSASMVCNAFQNLAAARSQAIGFRDTSLNFWNCTPRIEFHGDTALDTSLASRMVPKNSVWNRLTGQYLVGTVAVGIYLMESTGSSEDWYPAAEQQTFSEIIAGLDWLSREGDKRGAKVIWVYPGIEKISTTYEPIDMDHYPRFDGPSLDWQFYWLNDIFYAHGQPHEWDGVYGLADQMRRSLKTNWALEIAVVMDDHDPDHEFADHHYAYNAVYEEYSFPCCENVDRSPLVVMTYNNSNWYPWRMDQVAAHEVSHVFGTSDEYSGGLQTECRDSDDCSKSMSFLGAPNGNCMACNTSSSPCYMRSEPFFVCSFTPPELGWRDEYRVNEVPDPVDEISGEYMLVYPVAAGDIVTIVDLSQHFINRIAVTDDMLLGSNHDRFFWDGVDYRNNIQPIGYYAVSKNGTDLGTRTLQWLSGGPGQITGHHFTRDTIYYTMQTGYYTLRHTVYDSLGQIFSRPRYDIMTDQGTTVKSYIFGYPDGIYTSKVFGHRSDGGYAPLTSIRFVNYICGDINNSGSVDLGDISFLVNFLTSGGAAPPHPSSGDLNCSSGINLADLSTLVSYLTGSGAVLNCCHRLN
jgi:hypothetical protein